MCWHDWESAIKELQDEYAEVSVLANFPKCRKCGRRGSPEIFDWKLKPTSWSHSLFSRRGGSSDAEQG